MDRDTASGGARLSLQSASDLLASAEHLFEEGKLREATILALLSIEEMGKSEILQYYAWEIERGFLPLLRDYDVAFGEDNDDLSPRAAELLTVRRRRVRNLRGASNNGMLRDPIGALRDHNLKFQQFINWMNLSMTARAQFGNEYTERQGLHYRGGYMESLGVDLELLRSMSMYVDYDESSRQWEMPPKLSRQSVERLIDLVKMYRKWIETCLSRGYLYWEVNMDIGRDEADQHESVFGP